ncbi:MAG: TolC family protein, partial [Spirulinaceae cyanobacterium]
INPKSRRFYPVPSRFSLLKAWPPQLGLAIACVGGAVFTTAAALHTTSSPSVPQARDVIAPQVIPQSHQSFPNQQTNYTESPQLLGSNQVDRQIYAPIAPLPPQTSQNPPKSDPVASILSRSPSSGNPLNIRPRRSAPSPQADGQTTSQPKPHRSLLSFVRRPPANSSNQQAQTLPTEPLNLTLSDAIALTLANNRDIKNAYLERIAQRADLAVAENVFTPRLTPRVEGVITGTGNDNINQTTELLQLGANVAIKMPTGAEFGAQWQANAQSRGGSGQGVSLTFTQPLLRNAGVAVNTADVNIARLQAQFDVLDLRSTLSNTITETILAYRAVVQAQEQVKIQESALENAKRLFERDRALVEAGRIARVALVQSEARVARVEVDLVAARNNLEQTYLQLINLLDIDPQTPIIAIEQPTVEPPELNPEELREFMFANQPRLQQIQLAQQQAELALLKAEDNRRWNLDFQARYGETRDRRSDLRAGLVASQELGDRTRESEFQRSQVRLQQAQNNSIELQESLEIQLENRLRDVQLQYEQVQLALQALELAEQDLEIAQELRRLGRGNIREVIDLQQQLVNARNAELNAKISYLNARSRLDQTIGNTLNTWGVVISDN